MNEHLNSFNKILADLQNLDVEIYNEGNTLLLLNFLLDTYKRKALLREPCSGTKWR